MSPAPQAKIYVAGHRGLIGSALCRAFAQRGWSRVIVRDREQLDLRDAGAVDAFFEQERPEYVLLAAGRSGGIEVNRRLPADFIFEHLALELNVVRAARRCGVRRLILFASSCMYPREAAQPMAETLLMSGRPEPTSMAYAMAKLAGVELCHASNRQDGGTRFVPVIPNSVYGPGDNFDATSAHVLAALIRRFHDALARGERDVQLWGSGTPRREFVHADDLAEACCLLLEAPLAADGLPINIGSGEECSVRDLAQRIAVVAGYDGKIAWDAARPDGAPRKLLDSSRMRALGWRPRVSLDAGIAQTWQWYRDRAAQARRE